MPDETCLGCVRRAQQIEQLEAKITELNEVIRLNTIGALRSRLNPLPPPSDDERAVAEHFLRTLEAPGA
jgi:hypothetical protein